MQILYGTENRRIDITQICLKLLTQNNIVTIPSNDHTRASLFTDPVVGIEKQITIFLNNSITSYDIHQTIKIHLLTNEVRYYSDMDISKQLSNIQKSLKLNYGSFLEELPEQPLTNT